MSAVHRSTPFRADAGRRDVASERDEGMPPALDKPALVAMATPRAPCVRRPPRGEQCALADVPTR